ncbi:MAG: bis(5'-nucleosyl)-tetraphosphatase [Candidatus Hydrothermarchaeales archaeon]
MQIERSSGVVIFRKENGKREYLLLHYGAGHWDLPKGHIEEGEDPKETAKRELKEETGIEEIIFCGDFQERIDYTFKKRRELVYKEVLFFLARTNKKTVTLSYEHKGFEWLNFKDALEKLTYKNAKDVLGKAEAFLNQN